MTGQGPTQDFEWLKQTRFYWDVSKNDCLISITDVDFNYQYEYLGCKERLVITPLTDRCYVSLAQAIGLHLGGAPAGPAGTGKTETVKDMGRTLGIFVIVVNCSDQQRFSDMAKIFKGLCQAGLWGCFDEFNRIELPVLSVVAQQVLSITHARKGLAPQFLFPGDSQPINLKPSVHYAITMNPGYQGRQELPENLKNLFRGVVMVVPDREIIMKVKLCSSGYQEFVELAKKFNVLYRLCEQQLSAQKHYDWGLRNILSVLRTAGKTKRDNPEESEAYLLMSTLRSMNLSKLIASDVPLFLSLLQDIFPNTPFSASGSNQHGNRDPLTSFLHQALDSSPFVGSSSFDAKVRQLYEIYLVRHGIAIVGGAATGKSTISRVLKETLALKTATIHKEIRMNPKAIRVEELFGETDLMSGEWIDGVFGSIWSKFNQRARKEFIWIVCDAPVDAIWIESLNTLLDDNKILTLANGDRIPMSDNVKLLFETEDLRNASPATVSRLGILYVSNVDVSWRPVLEAWIQKQTHQDNGLKTRLYHSIFNRFFNLKEKTVEEKNDREESEVKHQEEEEEEEGHSRDLLDFIHQSCHLVLPLPDVSMIENMLRLISELLIDVDLVLDEDSLAIELERLILFAITWSIGSLLSSKDRLRFNDFLRSKSADGFPSVSSSKREQIHDQHGYVDGDEEERRGEFGEGRQQSLSIFDTSLNMDSMDWEPWFVPEWIPDASIQSLSFHDLLIPTMESQRMCYLLATMKQGRHPSLITGEAGTSKTTTTMMFSESFDPSMHYLKHIHFSSITTPYYVQKTLETELEKRGGKSFGPSNGRKMMFFLDDVSLPQKNEWGDKPTLELCRQLIETKTLCFLEKDRRGDFKHIEDVLYIAAMSHPKGMDDSIPTRLLRHFFILNLETPSDGTIQGIFGSILHKKFIEGQTISKPLIQLLGKLPIVTAKLWHWMREHMLPSPSKFHYIFTLKDISRVFEGFYRSTFDEIMKEEGKSIVHLWRHECTRTFADKLINEEDKQIFQNQLNEVTKMLTFRTVQLSTGNTGNQTKQHELDQGSMELEHKEEDDNDGDDGDDRGNVQSSKKADMKGSKQSISDKKLKAKKGSSKKKRPSSRSNTRSTKGSSGLDAGSSSDVKIPIVEFTEEDVQELPLFVDFMRDDVYDEDGLLIEEAPKVYERVVFLDVLSTRVE
jgi:dynein heavy chain